MIGLIMLAAATMTIDGHKCTSSDGHTWVCATGDKPKDFPQVEPIARKIGNANAVAECGIRPTSWYQPTIKPLEQVLASYILRLPKGLQREAQGYARATASQQERWILGRGLDGCRDLAKMPFVYRDEAFRP